MKVPHIKTAIPRRRYQLGSFMATVLAEVESDDPVDYRFIMALVEDGAQQPVLFVTSERNPPQQRAAGGYRLRVILGNQSKDMGSSDDWGDLEQFAMNGLGIVAKLYQLMDEQPVRLM